jgi:uncharacterized membrane protein YuzA (DUF378 family)
MLEPNQLKVILSQFFNISNIKLNGNLQMNRFSYRGNINHAAIKYAKSYTEELTVIMDRISLILVIIGALNWGGLGIFGFDTVAYLFGGQGATVSRVIYTLVGLAGIWCISLLFREREHAEDM